MLENIEHCINIIIAFRPLNSANNDKYKKSNKRIRRMLARMLFAWDLDDGLRARVFPVVL